jgi:putative ABC transport system substrate-binding protein
MRLMSLVLVLTFSFAPITVEAQQGQKVYGVGFLSSESASPSNGLEPLRQGLRDLGYVDGQNALIEARFAEYELDRLPALAAELVRLRMDVIVTFSTPAALAAKQATQTI